RDDLLARFFAWFGDSISFVSESPFIPLSLTLEQNYPNPFNPTTAIRFVAPQNTVTTLRVYNLLGQEVRTLYAGRGTGSEMTILFNGRNDAGTPLTSGVYVYRLEGSSGSMAKTLHLVR
ncbi:T9SS type A sorting domain-containing protein, partial [bacterium]|nr:T9SS type A sorting domain-containing protein [bacterium]